MGCCTCSATTTGTRWRHASRSCLGDPPGLALQATGPEGSPVNIRRAPTVFDSFNNAAEGIIHVLRTQRNMRIHFAVAFVVIVAALIVNVTKLELIALCISITFVLIAEMLNTGIESAIDISTTSFDPMAKIAK